MANEKTLEILKEIKADPKAKELFKGMEKPKSPDEAIAAYAQVAEKLGYGITAEDIREAVNDLGDVAGGGAFDCEEFLFCFYGYKMLPD